MRADKQSVTRLLKTARGQIDGILKMIEEDRYCVDISNQLMACEKVISRANRTVLLAHIHGCVEDAMNAGDKGKADEIAALLEKLL